MCSGGSCEGIACGGAHGGAEVGRVFGAGDDREGATCGHAGGLRGGRLRVGAICLWAVLARRGGRGGSRCPGGCWSGGGGWALRCLERRGGGGGVRVGLGMAVRAYARARGAGCPPKAGGPTGRALAIQIRAGSKGHSTASGCSCSASLPCTPPLGPGQYGAARPRSPDSHCGPGCARTARGQPAAKPSRRQAQGRAGCHETARSAGSASAPGEPGSWSRSKACPRAPRRAEAWCWGRWGGSAPPGTRGRGAAAGSNQGLWGWFSPPRSGYAMAAGPVRPSRTIQSPAEWVARRRRDRDVQGAVCGERGGGVVLALREGVFGVWESKGGGGGGGGGEGCYGVSGVWWGGGLETTKRAAVHPAGKGGP